MSGRFVPSLQIRWHERYKNVPNTLNGAMLIGGGTRVASYTVLQQWWHIQHEGHNSGTGLNGEWRDVPTARGPDITLAKDQGDASK